MALLNPDIKVLEAPLATTREHHEAMGSSGGSRKPEDYRKTAAELMNDEELRVYMDKELRVVREEHAALGKSNKKHTEMFCMIRDKFLLPNLRYLAEIGRLPTGYDIEAIDKELAIPEGLE